MLSMKTNPESEKYKYPTVMFLKLSFYPLLLQIFVINLYNRIVTSISRQCSEQIRSHRDFLKKINMILYHSSYCNIRLPHLMQTDCYCWKMESIVHWYLTYLVVTDKSSEKMDLPGPSWKLKKIISWTLRQTKLCYYKICLKVLNTT